MGAAARDLDRRGLLAAAVHRVHAARFERAARRRADHAGRGARDGGELAAPSRGGQRLEQTLGVGVVVAVEQVPALGPLHHLPAVHDDDLVGHVGDDAQVVGDEDDGGAELALQVPHHVEHLGLDGDVQCGGGLVGHEDRGVQRHRHRDHDALAHAAGELVRVVVDPRTRAGDPHRVQQVDRPLPGGGLRGAALVRADHLDDLPTDLVVGVEAGEGVLEDHADLGPTDTAQRVGVGPEEVLSVEGRPTRDASASGQADDGLGRDRLAGPGLPDDAERASPVNRERHAPHRTHDAVRGTERDVQIIHFEEWHVMDQPFLSASSQTLVGSKFCSESMYTALCTWVARYVGQFGLVMG